MKSKDLCPSWRFLEAQSQLSAGHVGTQRVFDPCLEGGEVESGGEMRNPSQNFPMRGSRPSLNKAWERHSRMAAVCITLLLLGPRQQESGFEGCCFPGLPL